MSFLGSYVRVVVQWFLSKIAGGMLHKCLARVWYFPSLLRMNLIEGPNWKWYNRVDSTVVLGALPFKRHAEALVEDEKVRGVVSLNEAYELRFFTPSVKEWREVGVQRFWFSTVDFNPPSLEDLDTGVQVIQDFKRRGESVYVHCKAGRGRSATMAACYLIKDYGYTPAEAVEFLKSKRPQVKINPTQFKVISRFYEELQSKKNL